MEAGTDVVENHRFLRSITRNGGRLKERIFSSEELSSAESLCDLAVIFSAKESIAKALGTGFDHRLSWHDIQIYLDGKTMKAELFGRAQELARGRKIHLSAACGEQRTFTCAVLSERG